MVSEYDVGTAVFNNWTIISKIGAGSFGTVYKIQRSDFGQTYDAALKVIRVPQTETEMQSLIYEGMTTSEAKQYLYGIVEDLVNEFAIMYRFKGMSNIVNYEDHAIIEHQDGQGWDILIRMELLTPLLTYTSEHSFTQRDVVKLGIDILTAIELCQSYNVIHRDIKLENIFVSRAGDFKLGDFGVARTIEKTMSDLSKKGTFTYMAPEVYLGRDYGFSVDIYSLGLVLYRFLNRGRAPFFPPAPAPITYSDRDSALAARMSGEKLPEPFFGSNKLKKIVLKACAYEPNDRYSSPAEMRCDLESVLQIVDASTPIYPYMGASYISGTFSSDKSATQAVHSNGDCALAAPATPMSPENSNKNTKKTRSWGLTALACVVLAFLLFLVIGNLIEYDNQQAETLQDVPTSGATDSSTVPQNLLKSANTYYDGSLLSTADYVFDNDGNLVSVTQFVEGSEGELIPFGSSVYTYNQSGAVTSYMKYDYDGTVLIGWAYTYDDDGQLIIQECIDNDGKTGLAYVFTYFSNGNLASIDKYESYSPEFVGDLISFTQYYYSDDLQRIIEINTIGSDLDSSFRVECFYDPSGNLVQETYYDGHENIQYYSYYTYDSNGNVLSERWENPDGSLHSIYKVEYSYPLPDLGVFSTDATVYFGSALAYEYDNNGNCTKKVSIYSNGEVQFWIEYTYNESGQLLRETLYDNDEVFSWTEYIY